MGERFYGLVRPADVGLPEDAFAPLVDCMGREDHTLDTFGYVLSLDELLAVPGGRAALAAFLDGTDEREWTRCLELVNAPAHAADVRIYARQGNPGAQAILARGCRPAETAQFVASHAEGRAYRPLSVIDGGRA